MSDGRAARKPGMMASTSFITRHPVLMYFALTFAISWGGFVLVVGPGGFPGTGSQFDALLPAADTLSGDRSRGEWREEAVHREDVGRRMK